MHPARVLARVCMGGTGLVQRITRIGGVADTYLHRSPQARHVHAEPEDEETEKRDADSRDVHALTLAINREIVVTHRATSAIPNKIERHGCNPSE